MIFASAVGLTQRVAQVGASLIALPLALHALRVRGFGVWGAATSLAWLVSMLDLGLGSALITLIPRSVASGQNDIARSHVAAALVCGCGLSVAIMSIGGVFVYFGVRADGTAPFYVAVVGLALNVPLSIAGNVWFGLHKGYIAGGWELVQTLLTLGLLAAAAACGGGVTAMVCAVYGALVLANLASFVHLFIFHPEMRPRQLNPGLRPLMVVVSQSGVLFALSVMVASSYMFDNLLILHWLGATASAQMTMAMRLCTTAAGMIAVVTQPLWPAFVEAESIGDRNWAMRTLCWGMLMVTVLSVAGAAIMVAFGAPILAWWLHSDIGIGPGLLWATGFWVVVMCTPRVVALLLCAALILRQQLIAATVALVSAIVLKIVLVGRFGTTGVLAATPISWLLIMWPTYLCIALRWRTKSNLAGKVPLFGGLTNDKR